MTCNFKLCDTFKISKLICFPIYQKERKREFKLVKHEQGKKYSFETLIPENEDYLYVKIDKSGRIICVEGGYVQKYKIKRKKIVGKKIDEINYFSDFLLDFIKPLHTKSLERGEAYQFLFTSNCHDENPHVCSVYPCSVPGKLTSTDIVIRHPLEIISKEDLQDFILDTTSNGERVSKLDN